MSAPIPWIALTVDGLLSSMTEREIADFGKVSTRVSVPDRVVPILSRLTAQIIGYIGSNVQNTLSPDPTLIPSEFEAHAYAIARWRVLTSIPGYQPGDAREKDYDKADAFFNMVARGSIRPRPAPDAVPSNVPNEKPAGIEVVSAPGSRTGRARMDGC